MTAWSPGRISARSFCVSSKCHPRGSGDQAWSPPSRGRHFVCGVVCGLVFLVSILLPSSSQALPQGGKILSGEGNIETAADAELIIRCTTKDTVFEFVEFSVAEADRVKFVLPDDSSYVLVRSMADGGPS